MLHRQHLQVRPEYQTEQHAASRHAAASRRVECFAGSTRVAPKLAWHLNLQVQIGRHLRDSHISPAAAALLPSSLTSTCCSVMAPLSSAM